MKFKSYGSAGAAAIVLSVVACVRADAPATLAGRVFYQTGTTVTAGLRAYHASAAVLHADGRFTGLYGLTWDIVRASGGWQAPHDGTWEYVRTSSSTGTLQLRTSGSATEHLLTFVSDRQGSIASSPLSGQTFAFALSDAAADPAMANVSLRATVNAGGTAIAGFVVGGAGARTVLVRAVGPGLTGFGVTNAARNPKLSVPKLNAPLNANDDWSVGNSVPSLRRVESLTGAFPLADGSADAAIILPGLAAGAYTVHVEAPTANDAGEVLIEVYVLP